MRNALRVLDTGAGGDEDGMTKPERREYMRNYLRAYRPKYRAKQIAAGKCFDCLARKAGEKVNGLCGTATLCGHCAQRHRDKALLRYYRLHPNPPAKKEPKPEPQPKPVRRANVERMLELVCIAR